MNRVLEILSALADPTRLNAMAMLWDGEERCVCELMEALDATQSRMSRHMSVLKSAGLVIDRRDAQWVRYRRNPQLDPKLAAIAEAALAALGREAKPAKCRSTKLCGTKKAERAGAA